MSTGLQKQYVEKAVSHLMKELKIKNKHAVPKLEKIIINIGIGSWIKQNGKNYSEIEKNFVKITGQKASLKIARISVSNFKLRAGMPVGMVTTLRKQRMYDFLERLIAINLPRVRDFRGLNKKMDKNGNYSLGIKDYSMFSELSPDDITKPTGLGINFVFSNSNKESTIAFFEYFGFPFKK
jgi:large subunit ribosomal protein L5